MMDTLQIDGHSIKFVDRKVWKKQNETILDNKLRLNQKLFIPFKLDNDTVESSEEKFKINRKCPEVIEVKARRRRILKRPKRFKNYYTNRKPFTIPSFQFPRHVITFYIQYLHIFISHSLF